MMGSTGRIGSRERREIAAVFFWSLLSLVALCMLFMRLVRRERRVAGEVQQAEQLLASYERKVDGMSIAERILAERNKKQYLLDEWKRYSNLLETWKTNETAGNGDAVEAARIDFKVALFNAREDLIRRAEQSGTILPVDIGISESIGVDEDTSVRLLQLAAVHKLVGFGIDLEIPRILEIEALQPEPVPAADGGKEYLDQYPVRLRIRCSLNTFVRFLAQVMKARHFFTIANVFAEKTSRQDPDLLDVAVVFNALVLKEEEP